MSETEIEAPGTAHVDYAQTPEYDLPNEAIEGITCPTCVQARANAEDAGVGEDDLPEIRTFDTERAMKIHHTQAHGESIAYKTCPQCDEEFLPRTSDQTYCTVPCVNEARSKRVTLECAYCEDPFEAHNYRADEAKYCSPKCGYRDHRDRILFQCEWCYKAEEIWPAVADRKRFCSHRCQWIAQREYLGIDRGPIPNRRPKKFDDLLRHVYIFEGMPIEATHRIINHELGHKFDEAYSLEEIKQATRELLEFEVNFRNRLWMVRPEDLGLSPIGGRQ